jgi:hypothetical protein
MTKFNRKFDVDDIEEVLDAPENAWFRDLLKYWRPAGDAQGFSGTKTLLQAPADHLRLAIRDGYLNFYRAGQSAAKVSVVRHKLQGEIHNKYVYGDQSGRQEYVKITDGTFKNHDGARLPYRDNLVHDWILKANGYAEEEKRFVDEVIAHQAGTIDLEAGLPADPELWSEKSAPRMDLVTLEPCGDHYRLVFWEAKLVTNSEARCKDADAAPKVIAQLKKYERWIAKNRKFVCKAYQRCCKDLVLLHGIAKGLNKDMPELGKAIIAVGLEESPLCIDGSPRLIIDATKGDGVFAQHGHLKKLQDLGICVQMVRTPADMLMSTGA